MQKWSSIAQYSCTSVWDLKYTFSKSFFLTHFYLSVIMLIMFLQLYQNVINVMVFKHVRVKFYIPGGAIKNSHYH